MSSDGSLEPGWFAREIDRTQREELHQEAARRETMLRAARIYLEQLSEDTERTRLAAEYIMLPRQTDGDVALRTNYPPVLPASFSYQNITANVVPAGGSVYVADDRCMDTVARSMAEEARCLECTRVEDIPFGEYVFAYLQGAIRFTISCRTIAGGERLVYIMWDNEGPFLGTIRMNRNDGLSTAMRLTCRHGNMTMVHGTIKIISQHITPPTQTSHVRRVEL